MKSYPTCSRDCHGYNVAQERLGRRLRFAEFSPGVGRDHKFGGSINPVPPAGGGNVVGPLFVGNSGVGTMGIADGTALTNTSNATVGASADAVGIVTMNGLGSDWTLTTATADLNVELVASAQSRCRTSLGLLSPMK